ncbi:PAS domain-containing sensor histidine kinase [Nibribacter koreensis]|uniref:histidine kinase n=1 Tax=Nibribacter koreensis TaxID=1084519 RepID=A0ABP8FMS5_9BACT
MNSELELVSRYNQENPTEDIYRLLIEGIKDYAIFLLDPEGRIATWNAGAKSIKQYEPADVLGKHFSIFYTPEAISKNYPAYELEQALKNGRFEDEGWRVRKDGIVFWANVIFTPIYNEEGKHLGFSKITRDLSERKKAEDDLYKAYEELKDSEERFRRLVEGVTDYAIFMLDPSGHVATWNEGARRIKGYEAHEIIGKYFAKFYSRESVLTGFPEYELKEAKAHGRFEDEGWRYRKDGTAFWANVIITAIFNEKKELIGFSKITRDLTEKKQLEEQLFRTNEELRESEEKSRLMIDSVQDYAILMLNTEGLIVSWNTGAERIKGYTAQEVIGKHFSLFYPREAIENGFPAFELSKAIQDGRFEDEGWRVRKDGAAFWANVVLSPVYNSDHRLLGFAKITRDLTERRRNEDLMQKNKELVRINNDLDNFVYTASHDLKSPIANLEGLLLALKEDMGKECIPHQNILSMMGSSLETLRKVINDLSEVTKLQQAKDQAEQVSLHTLLEEVKANLRDSIKNSNAEIMVGDLEFDSLSFSRKNLRSILYNLVSNAIKYKDPQRAPKITISSKIADNGDYVLSVTDNGLGIPAHQVSKIFAMYKRVHDHVEGTGIGLYLVKKILDNSGDDITVRSELGKGTAFHVHFKNQNS